jgi:hypothetical protein
MKVTHFFCLFFRTTSFVTTSSLLPNSSRSPRARLLRPPAPGYRRSLTSASLHHTSWAGNSPIKCLTSIQCNQVKLLPNVSRNWEIEICLCWFYFRLLTIFTTATSSLKMTLDLKMVKIDSKIIILMLC